MSKTSELLRAQFGASDAARDAGLATPGDVVRYDNLPYGAHGHWQLLDVYRPGAAGDAPLPVIVNVHGGGWVYGTKETYQFYGMSLAQRGFAVVNFTYRLAPEFQFPAPLEDTNLVFSWLLGHALEYGFRTDCVFAVGDSAGANILAQYCAVCTNPAYAARFGFRPPEGALPQAVALNCGKYDFAPGRLDGQTRALLADYLPGCGTPEGFHLLDVPAHITGGFPPAFLMTSSGDFLRGEVPVLAQRLEACGVPFRQREYGRDGQPGHVFHCDIRSPLAKQCNDEECAYFREFIRP